MITSKGINSLLRVLGTVAVISVLAAAPPAWGQARFIGAAASLCTEADGTMENGEQGAEQGHQRIVWPMARKLLRGLGNLTLGWAELPKQVVCIGRERGWLIGVTRGPFDGVGMSLARMLAGAYEIVTFPVPVPPRYQTMVKPDYVWQPEPHGDGRLDESRNTKH